MISRLFFASAMAVAMASRANAATLSETNYAGWTIGAYSSDATGAFSYCGASVPYKSGTTLIFTVGTGGWLMGLTNPRWQMPKDATYPVSLQIDRNQPISLSATAATPDLAIARLETSAYLFQLFKSGRILRIQAAGESMGFDLMNSSKALDLTLQCAKARLAFNQPSNPFSSGSPTRAAEPDGAAVVGHTAETTAFLANILSAAGIQGFSLAPETSAEMKPWEVVWTAPHVVGLARIDEKSNVDDSAMFVAASDGNRCKGNFASTKQPSTDGRILLLKTACQSPDAKQSFQYSYTIAPRAAGGAYITAAMESVTADAQHPSADAVGPRLLDASVRYFSPDPPK